MSTVERVENLVLGGGEAGEYPAWELAKRGDAIFTHPTMAEGLNVLFAKVPPLEAPARADAR